MFKDLLAKYYKKKRREASKKALKGIKIFLEKRKKKSSNMVVNYIKISRKTKNKVEYRKKYYKAWKNKTTSKIKTN